MPWNKPGDQNNNNNPWGGKSNGSPPDLDKILSDFIRKLRMTFGGSKSNGNRPNGNGSNRNANGTLTGKEDFKIAGGILAGVIIILWFFSGIFIVNPAEETVILRFGKYSEVLQPGLHWFARFIETKYTVDVQKIYSFSLQGDFLTKSSEQNDLPNSQYIQYDALAKTPGFSDQSKNLVNVELNVQYRITNPKLYLFNIVNPDETIQQVSSSALSDVIGTMKLDDVLTTGRESLSLGVSDRVKKIIASYNTGLEVIAVTLRKVQAPDQVRVAFSDVNRADQDRATFIQQAQAYASKVVPLAQGAAARILADASGYQQKVVLESQGDVSRYSALQTAYSNAPEITRERMYLETIQSVLQNTTKVLVDSGAGNNLLYLPLDKLVNQSNPTVTKVPSLPPIREVK